MANDSRLANVSAVVVSPVAAVPSESGVESCTGLHERVRLGRVEEVPSVRPP